jgi:hypothetical protein
MLMNSVLFCAVAVVFENGRWQYLFPLLVEFRVPVKEARTVLLTHGPVVLVDVAVKPAAAVGP